MTKEIREKQILVIYRKKIKHCTLEVATPFRKKLPNQLGPGEKNSWHFTLSPMFDITYTEHKNEYFLTFWFFGFVFALTIIKMTKEMLDLMNKIIG